MISAKFDQVEIILCLGAHADDIEIGCGGTILKLLQQHKGVQVYWVVLSATDQRAEEARRSAQQFLAGAAASKVIVKEFRDSYFPYTGDVIKDFFFELQNDVQPDVVFTHRREDLHQDHRLVSELTWNTFRDHLILEYEISKYDGDLGQPNVFVPIDEPTCQRKINTIVESFQSVLGKPWFTEDAFWALLRIRGVECKSSSKFAEGLYCRKMIL